MKKVLAITILGVYALVALADPAKIYTVQGSPESVQYGNNGDLVVSKTGQAVYIKTGGYGNTNWVALWNSTGGLALSGTTTGNTNLNVSVLTGGTFSAPNVVSAVQSGTTSGTVTDSTTRTATGTITVSGTAGGGLVVTAVPATPVAGSIVYVSGTGYKIYLTATTGFVIKTGTNVSF